MKIFQDEAIEPDFLRRFTDAITRKDETALALLAEQVDAEITVGSARLAVLQKRSSRKTDAEYAEERRLVETFRRSGFASFTLHRMYQTRTTIPPTRAEYDQWLAATTQALQPPEFIAG